MNIATPPLTLRPPSEVMRLQRMGAFFPTRLSFMRVLLRRLAQEKAQITRTRFALDDNGYGNAVYTVPLGGHEYSLVAFSSPLAESDRTDRVIAEAWDTSYVLYDGQPTAEEIARLAANVPLQEGGRFCERDLVLSRANKSVRLFNHTIDALAAGRQPDQDILEQVGYLMRTTAVYGNGKFGIADRHHIADYPGLALPFQAELLTVWLIRGFTHDLADHIAACRNPKAVALSRDNKHRLGIGNSTGLGMAPFIVNHPMLLNNWIQTRETALARVLALTQANATTMAHCLELITRVRRHLECWQVADERQTRRITVLRQEWQAVTALVSSAFLRADNPWRRLFDAAQAWSVECQELIVALLLEPHGELIDTLADEMAAATNTPALSPAMTVDELRSLLTTQYDWGLKINFANTAETQLFWYLSEEKSEPRLGRRYQEAGEEHELPHDIARRMQALLAALEPLPAAMTVAEFLTDHPHHRYAVRRAQALAAFPYGEIHDNLIGEDCLPIDLLRCKLSFFGANKFDPKSDRWTRITLYQGAPLFDETAANDADDWWLAAG